MSSDPLIPPGSFSDPSATYLNISCFDLLMIELVPMAYRLANQMDAAISKGQDNKGEDGCLLTNESSSNGNLRSSMIGSSSTENETRRMEEDQEKYAVFFRLEALGYRVGQGLVERSAFHLLVNINRVKIY